MSEYGPPGKPGWVPATCEVCGEELGSTPFVLLNRWALGTGKNRRYEEALDDEGEHLWDVQGQNVAGSLYHFPGCLVAYLEGSMFDTDFEVRSGEAE